MNVARPRNSVHKLEQAAGDFDPCPKAVPFFRGLEPAKIKVFRKEPAMNTPRRWVLALVAGTVASLIAGAESQPVRQTEGVRFVQVGRYDINVDRINYTRDEGKVLVVVLGAA